jgi:hypothetical protein
MSSLVESDELNKIIKVEDEATSAGLDEAAAVEDDSSVGLTATSKGKRKTFGVWQYFT